MVMIGAGFDAGLVANGLPGLPSTSVLHPRELREREGPHLAGAVRGAVERRVVDRHRHAVLGELGVHLQDEAVAGSVLVRGEALLGVLRLAVHDGAAAVGVDLGAACGGAAAAAQERARTSKRRQASRASRGTISSAPVSARSTISGCTSPRWAATPAARSSRSSSRATAATSRTSGPPLSRRARRPVLREHRLRLRRGDGRGGRRPDARAAVRHQLDLRPPARDRAGRRDRGARPRRPQPRVLRVGRLRGRRGGLEARRASTTRARGERRWKAIARRVAYHGTTMGALSINGCTELRTPFEPLVPDVLHVSNTNRYHRPPERDRGRVHRASCSTSSRRRSSRPAPTPSRW